MTSSIAPRLSRPGGLTRRADQASGIKKGAGGVNQNAGRIGWVRRVMMVLVGIFVGIALVSPSLGHIGASARHLWKQHIRPKADGRYVGSQKMLWAYVEADGSLRNGKGATAAQPGETTGQYVVTFNRNVSRCAWNATRSEALESAGLIAASGGSDPNTVVVEIHNPSGLEGDETPFSLAVLC